MSQRAARRLRPGVWIGAALLSFTTTPAAAALDEREHAIADYVQREAPAVLDELVEVLEISSPTEDHEGVREAGRWFANRFEALGFETRWIDQAEVGRAGHLLAERAGDRGERVLLLGHLDTVLPAVPVRREDGKLFGSGAGDMKGGNVLALFALRALHATGALDGARVSVLFTGDEESVGRPLDAARHAMREVAARSDLALSFEGGADSTAVVARRSSSSWRIDVEAATGHSSGVFGERLGSGAIYEAARILDAFHTGIRGEPNATFNAAQIVGGLEAEIADGEGRARGKSNIIPARAVVRGDLRVLTRGQLEDIERRMRAIVENGNLPGTSARIEFTHKYPPMAPAEGNYALLARFSEVSEDLGYGPVEAFDPARRGAGDIAFVADLVPGLDGLGVTGRGAHAAGEYLDTTEFVRQVQRTAVLLHRLTR